MANLPPEVPDRTIRDNLAKYGEVKDIQEELRARACRYKVSNGMRIVEMSLKLHLPSHMIIAGHRVFVSNDGQPSIYYGCNESGHQYQDCPNRKRIVPPENIPSTTTSADIVKQNTRNAQPAMPQHNRNHRRYLPRGDANDSKHAPQPWNKHHSHDAHKNYPTFRK